MSLFDIPFLSKLTRAIGENKGYLVYNNQTTPVELTDAELIYVDGSDTALIEVSGQGASNDLNIRVQGRLHASGSGNHILDVYDFNTKRKVVDYTSGASGSNSSSGINKEGIYIVNVQGFNLIRLPLYSLGNGGVSVRVTLSQSFGGFAAGSPVSIESSRHEQVIFTNENKHRAYTMIGSQANSTQFFTPTSAGQRYLEGIPHAEHGIFEQVFFIRNNTPNPITDFTIGGDLNDRRVSGSSRLELITNSFLEVPQIDPGQAIMFVSDGSETQISGLRAALYIVPELRLPFWKFRMSYKTEETTGSIYVQSIRRY